MIFLDTNVLIDLLEEGEWRTWSQKWIELLGADHELAINPVVFAELASRFDSSESLRRWLAAFPIAILALDEDIAFECGSAFRAFRRQYRERDAILSDFLIGGHARYLDAPLMTRDTRIYRRYFSELTLITPETAHD